MSIRHNLAWLLRWSTLTLLIVVMVMVFTIVTSEQARSQEIDEAQERFWSWVVPMTFGTLALGSLVMVILSQARRRARAKLLRSQFAASVGDRDVAADGGSSLTDEEVEAIRESFLREYSKPGFRVADFPLDRLTASSIHRAREERAKAEAVIQAQDDKRRKRMERSSEIEQSDPPIILSPPSYVDPNKPR